MNHQTGSIFGRRTHVISALMVMLLAGCAQTPIQQSGPILYPPLPQQPRLQFLTVISSEASLGQEEASTFRDFVVGKEQKRVDSLGRPFALGHTPDFLYVLDRNRMAVVRVDLETGKFKTISDIRSGPLLNAVSIFVDKEDWRIYVVDQKRQEVLVYNDRDEFEQSYSTGENTKPVDVVVTEDKLFVSNLGQNDILVLDKATGELIETLGGLGRSEGLFNKPTNLAIDDSGNIAAVDTLNYRVQVIDQDGNYVTSVGQLAQSIGGMVRPKGLDFDRAGNVYVADAAFEFVTIWQLETRAPMMPFGKTGTAGGLYLPTDVHIDYDNVGYFQKFADPNMKLDYIVYVANSLASVSVYGFGEWTGPLRQPRRGRTTDDGASPDKSNAPPALEDIGTEEGSQR